MANRYWRGGSGTWNSSNTTNWSTTSGGAGGASVPTSADVAIFNASSGAGATVTISGDVPCASFNTTGFTGTLSGGTISIYSGTSTIATSLMSAPTFNINNRATGTTATTLTINYNYVTISSYTKSGTSTGTHTINGTGAAPTVNSLSSSAGNITFSSTGNAVFGSGTWNISNGNLTCSSGIVHTGNLTIASTGKTLSVSNVAQFHNLTTYSGGTFPANTTIDNFYLYGGSVGAGNTITCSSSATVSNASLSDVNFFKSPVLNIDSGGTVSGATAFNGGPSRVNIVGGTLALGVSQVSFPINIYSGTLQIGSGSSLYNDLYFATAGTKTWNILGSLYFYNSGISFVDSGVTINSSTAYTLNASNCTFSTNASNINFGMSLFMGSDTVFQSGSFELQFHNLTSLDSAISKIVLNNANVKFNAVSTEYTDEANRIFVYAPSGSANKTLTFTSTSTPMGAVDYYNITMGNAFSSNPRAGDCGGNTGLGANAPVARYRTSSTASTNWYDTANWSASPGGAGGASAPLVQDTASFTGAANGTTTYINRSVPPQITAVSTTSIIINQQSRPVFKSINFSSAGVSAGIRGGWELAPTPNGTQTISVPSLNNATNNFNIYVSSINTSSTDSSWSLGTDLKCNEIWFNNPITFNTNDKNISAYTDVTFSNTSCSGSFGASTITTQTLNDISGNPFTLSGVTWATPLAASGPDASYTFYHSPAKLLIQSGTVTTGTISVSTKLSYVIGELQSTSTNTFALFSPTGTKVNKWSVSGSSGTLVSISGNYTYTGTGVVSADYLSISSSTVTPSTLTWYAGTHSTNGGSNSGWIFTAAPSTGGNGLFFGSNF